MPVTNLGVHTEKKQLLDLCRFAKKSWDIQSSIFSFNINQGFQKSISRYFIYCPLIINNWKIWPGHQFFKSRNMLLSQNSQNGFMLFSLWIFVIHACRVCIGRSYWLIYGIPHQHSHITFYSRVYIMYYCVVYALLLIPRIPPSTIQSNYIYNVIVAFMHPRYTNKECSLITYRFLGQTNT